MILIFTQGEKLRVYGQGWQSMNNFGKGGDRALGPVEVMENE